MNKILFFSLIISFLCVACLSDNPNEMDYSERKAPKRLLAGGAFGAYKANSSPLKYDSNRKLELDFFTTSKKGKQPLIVFLPPGGFITHDKGERLTQRMCRDFARAGYYTAAVSYTLLTDFRGGRDWSWDYVRIKLAEAMHDVPKAISFLRERGDELGFDTENIILVGFSAGGILALHSVFSDGEEINHEYLQNGNFEYERPLIKGIISIGGALLVDHIDDDDYEHTPILLFHGEADNIVPIGYGHPYEKFIKDTDIELPGPSAILSIKDEKNGEKITIDGVSYYIHIPKWIFEYTITAATPELYGSAIIESENLRNIKLVPIKDGKHVFMVNKDGYLNMTYLEMREQMLQFIQENTSTKVAKQSRRRRSN